MPNPNAKPLNFFESMLQLFNTIGFTIPHPSISSQSPFSDNISTSADGSVNGKYDGLNLISLSSPNRAKIILYIKSFKCAKHTSSAT